MKKLTLISITFLASLNGFSQKLIADETTLNKKGSIVKITTYNDDIKCIIDYNFKVLKTLKYKKDEYVFYIKKRNFDINKFYSLTKTLGFS